MTEFIGSRISLISKRDIRYVGTLHEISSENSTVALENVTSYGTEGRRPEEEIPPNLESIYEYIVFRGSDVKDLRIEEGPKEAKKPDPPKMPDDPAILGNTRKPKSANPPIQPPTAPAAQAQTQGEQAAPPQPNQPNQTAQPRQGPPPPQFAQQPYPYGFPPPNQRFGAGGFPPGPPGPGFPGMHYGGGPPGWYPPYGFPQMPPNQFPPQMPIGPPGQQQRGQPANPSNEPPNEAAPSPAPQEGKAAPGAGDSKPVATVKLPSSDATPVQQQAAQAAPPLPNDTKPDVAAALAPSAAEAKPGPKSGRIVPAIPLSPAIKTAATANGTAGNKSGSAMPKSIEEANRDARAAVAAAMAKLPPSEKKQIESSMSAIDSVTKSLGELRTVETARRGRGNRGVNRGGRDNNARRIEVPKTDYDFESANAKFNKHDLVKEAIATGSPVGTPTDVNGGEAAENGIGGKRGSESGISIPVGVSYNKSSSFFDDISSEIKDRAEGTQGGQRLGGREFRNEERQKNLETFGQGSVDNYRYGRGRGRGRGFGRGRGRGGYNARGGNNGGRNRQGPATVEG